MQYTIYIILAPIVAIVSIAVIVYTWRYRTASGVSALIWAMVAVSGWLILNILELADTSESGTVFWAKISYPFFTLAPVAWLAFALQYTGRHQWLTPARLALLCIIPVVNSLLALTNELHHLIWKSYSFVPINGLLAMNVVHGPWFWGQVIYSYALIFLGAFIISREYFRSFKLYRQQSIWLVIGAVSPIIANVVYISHLIPGFRKDYSPLSFAFAGLAFAIGMFRYRLFDLRPVARNALIDRMSDGMLVLDEQGRIVDINPAARQMLGLAKADVIGQPAAQILNPWPALVEHFLDATDIQTDVAIDREGTQRHYDLRISPLTDRRGHLTGRLIVWRDITERKQTEKEIQLLGQVAQQMKDAVILTDSTPESRIQYVNDAFSALYGYTKDEVLGKPSWILFAGDDAERDRIAEERDEVVAREGEYRIEYRDRRKDGSTFWVSNTSSQVYLGEAKEPYDLGIVRDITDRKRAEEQLQHYAAELERSNEEVKQFAYIVSHDLRAPLVNLRGFTTELRYALDVIQSSMDAALPHLDEKQRLDVTAALREDVPEALDFIDSSVSRTDNFLSALLKLSRLGRRELNLEPVDVNAIVQATLKALAHQIEERQVKVTVGPLPGVIADRTSVEQIIGNVLDDAVKYLEPGRPGEMEITGERGHNETIFRIRDNGRGIAEEDMNKVFAPFRRAGRQDVPGEGMGLPYVQTLVRRHGGQIWCESQPGVGTTFTFTISNHLAKGADHAQ